MTLDDYLRNYTPQNPEWWADIAAAASRGQAFSPLTKSIAELTTVHAVLELTDPQMAKIVARVIRRLRKMDVEG